MPDLMSEAINLMLVGMGFVFMFLTVLVFVTSSMSRIVTRFSPAPEAASISGGTGSNDNQQVNPVSSGDAQLVAVLSAAISKYRSKHKQ